MYVRMKIGAYAGELRFVPFLTGRMLVERGHATVANPGLDAPEATQPTPTAEAKPTRKQRR